MFGSRPWLTMIFVLAIGWIGVADGLFLPSAWLEVNGRDGGATTDLEVVQESRASSITMEAWVYPSSVSHGRHPVLTSDNGGYDWSVLREGASWHVFTGSRSVSTGLAVDENAWQHIAAVFSGGHVVFYKNGQTSAPQFHPRRDRLSRWLKALSRSSKALASLCMRWRAVP